MKKYFTNAERSYDWLLCLFAHCRKGCLDACGCGHCYLDMLEDYAFGDHSVYKLR